MRLSVKQLRSRFHSMKTIQVVLDERTLKTADREVTRAEIDRSALVRSVIALFAATRRGMAPAQRLQPIGPGSQLPWLPWFG